MFSDLMNIKCKNNINDNIIIRYTPIAIPENTSELPLDISRGLTTASAIITISALNMVQLLDGRLQVIIHINDCVYSGLLTPIR